MSQSEEYTKKLKEIQAILSNPQKQDSKVVLDTIAVALSDQLQAFMSEVTLNEVGRMVMDGIKECVKSDTPQHYKLIFEFDGHRKDEDTIIDNVRMMPWQISAPFRPNKLASNLN